MDHDMDHNIIKCPCVQNEKKKCGKKVANLINPGYASRIDNSQSKKKT